MVEKTLVPAKEYLQTGAHIGAKFKSDGMRKYIFKHRKDKLKVLDVGTIDDRIRIAAKFLSSFEPEKIAAASQKEYGQTAAKKFAELIGAKALVKRFVPGTFTNPMSTEFMEPQVLLVTDPNSDRQAIREAKRMRFPVIAFCSTDNQTKNIDLIVPINNKGRKSLALAYWLLTREILREKGIVKTEGDFKAKLEEFEFIMDEKTQMAHYRQREEGRDRFERRGRRDRDDSY
ncbi:MAG: 30S ribosomal protein S2 [Candidatus Diapherotrites archaeon]